MTGDVYDRIGYASGYYAKMDGVLFLTGIVRLLFFMDIDTVYANGRY